MRAQLHPEADAELVAAARWYEDRNLGLGNRFLEDYVRGVDAIERTPDRYPKMPGQSKRDVRRYLLHHFPYALVYEIRADACVILAVAHARRRAGYWRNR